MLDKPGVRQLAADQVSRLPWLAPPAGYIVLIQDVAYGNRYKIARHQQLDRYQIKRGADFPFQTRVVLILEAENAAQAERDLHVELAAGAAIGDWFDLAEFPKSPPAQTMAPAPTRPQELVSLRDLVENDEGADSLLKEADIVAAKRHVSRPRRPARPEPSSAQRRRPRAARWAFALGLLVLVGLIAAEGPSDIWNAIESMLDARTQQSNSPTPAVEGRGEVFFTSARAPLRICAASGCRAVEMLDPGFRITARKFVKGQRVNGSTRWIATLHQGELRYIHDSVLARSWPPVEPTTTRSRSASPTPQIVGRDEVFYSKTRSRVRTCANMSCRTAAFLNAGTKITARRYVSGQQVNGSARWIAFLHEGELHYIHDTVLARSWPPVEPTPQPSPSEKPTRIQATAVGQGEVFYVRSKANARHCARLSCEILDVLPPGTKITALRFVAGETIDGNDLWIRFSYNRRHLSIHSSKLTRTDPNERPTQIRATAVGQGEVFYLRSKANARHCARLSCEILDVLPPGTKITALRFVPGETIDGSDLWIRFSYNRRHLSIHSSKLTRTDPNARAGSTAQPQEPNSVDAGAKFFLKIRARARACPRRTCYVAATLPIGTQITAKRYVSGQTEDGDDGWVSFDYNGRTLYILQSLLSRHDPLDAPGAQPTPIAQPAGRSQSSTADSTPRYVIENATVYKCVNTSCQAIDVLERGTEIYPSGEWYGQRINDSNHWFRLRHDDQTVYIHSSFVTEDEPAFEPTATELQPTATSTMTEPPSTATSSATEPPAATATVTVASAAKYVVETAGNVNANIRACPRTSCEIVAKFAPGTEIDALGSAKGETVYQTDVWLEISFKGGSAYIHSELAVAQ